MEHSKCYGVFIWDIIIGNLWHVAQLYVYSTYKHVSFCIHTTSDPHSPVTRRSAALEMGPKEMKVISNDEVMVELVGVGMGWGMWGDVD